jgi:hypothetical protein
MCTISVWKSQRHRQRYTTTAITLYGLLDNTKQFCDYLKYSLSGTYAPRIGASAREIIGK